MSSPRWSLATRIVFRFVVIYFSLYAATTRMLDQLLQLPVGRLPSTTGRINRLVIWTGSHAFHVVATPTFTGSGDRMFDWVQAFCVLVIAIIGATAWSMLDHRRERYDRLSRWFRVFLRFTLGATMILYGFSKVFPLQMPAPALTRLLEPYGHLSMMGVLWSSIGASFPYERFIGLAEVCGGVLLFVPRTAMLGALICLANTIEIVVLNLAYDVPVKLFAFHLLLMSAVLVAPAIGSILRPAFSSGARHRWAAVAQVVFGAYLAGMVCYYALEASRSLNSAAKPPLYGIWVIDDMSIDGRVRAPLVTDNDRWRRVVIQTTTSVTFWRMDDTALAYPATTDADRHTITLSKEDDTAWTAQLTFERPAPDRLVLDGVLDRHAIHMATHLFDTGTFPLMKRGFHWIQEVPPDR